MTSSSKEKNRRKSPTRVRSGGQRPKESKPTPRPTKSEAEAEGAANELPLELQQLLLNVFQNSFPDRFDDHLTGLLQEVKGHLYNRDFTAAFGRNEYLEAYAVRWSPARTLGYLKIFGDVIREYFDIDEEPGEGKDGTLKVVSLGGGAGAEVVGLAGALRLRDGQNQQDDVAEALEELSVDEKTRRFVNVQATFVDIANWKHIIDKLQLSITTAPPLSAYASAAAKANNISLIAPSNFSVSFIQSDVLALDEDELRNLTAVKDLITVFFTLNELYSTSLPRTQAFLLRLTRVVTKGSLLLVVDSAGSYSTVSLNGKEKKYPMHWLLDHALLKEVGESTANKGKDDESQSSSPSWEKLQETESEWFRVPGGLKYPLELENMRYQLHLYRRL